MKKIVKYLWYVPALYTAYMFGNKIVEGFGHSEEFQTIISVIQPLKPYAYTLTPFVGILDFFIGFSLLFNMLITKNESIQKFLFVWVIVWPFIPSSLRYFGNGSSFELGEVLSISLSALASFLLWLSYSRKTSFV